MEVESLKKLKSTVEKCLTELAKKPDLTPAETKAALDGMQLREMLLCEIDNTKMKEEYSERGYSSRDDLPYRRYNITAYGYPGMPMMQGSYGMYDWPRSYDGRAYDGRAYEGPEYSERRHNYSRHSIADRAVEKLENLMDQAGSEYEREELHRFIKMIRQSE